MDEFIAYLIAGLVIIAIFLVVFNVGSFSATSYARTTIDSGTSLLETEGTIPIGVTQDEIYAPTHFINFKASYVEDTNNYELPDRKLVNGLLFGSNEMLIDVKALDSVSEAYLTFNVKDTNKYGPLVILVNNEQVASAPYNLGSQKMEIPSEQLNKLIGDVTITVKPASSGWFIWAPNLYDLAEVELVITGMKQNTQNLDFELTDDQTEGHERGWITLTEMKRTTGAVSIFLNDRHLYNGSAAVTQIDYDKEDLQNENTLTIVPEKNAKMEGNMNFLLYYRSQKDNTVTMDFDLSSDAYNNLASKAGQVRFKVIDVLENGGINLKLNGETICKSVTCYPIAEPNTYYTFYFRKAEASIGSNELVVGSVDNGAFTIKNLKVVVD